MTDKDEIGIDTDELICPYCGAKQETHEPDVISANCCYTACEECYQFFWYQVKVTRSYYSMPE